MNKDNSIQLKEWNSGTRNTELTGECVNIYTIAKSMTTDNFTKLLDEYLNLGGKDFREGKQVGLNLRFTHRTLQRLAICFSFGLIAGLAEQEYTDPRNETAIQTAKRVVQMMEAGDLPLGLYI